MPELIEIQNKTDNPNWNPFVGDETFGLLRSNSKLADGGGLNETGRRVLDETLRIMQVCGNPVVATNNETGIVIGYVQSGKTLSFTTLTALARDNHYQIVIVLGGTTKILLQQSTDRLIKDLRINSRYGFEQKWLQLTNPNLDNQVFEDSITDTLGQWADNTFPKDKCKTILITVMKNGTRLRKLASLLQRMNLQGVPTLIIDDEGDQASLNTRAARVARQGIDIEDLTENDVSTIYKTINALRNILPHHTFLQYTATPQANLFINIMDRLSPNFIKLLTPGDEYTGGITFFEENPNLIIEIPSADLPSAQPLHEAPNSLLRALKIFYLGVASGQVLKLDRDPSQRNRSMLIHPSRLQDDHNTFYYWVNTIKESWRRLLTGTVNEEKAELLNEFLSAYNDLQTTVPNLPPFEQLSGLDLVHAIQYTPITEVNARQGTTTQVNWQNSYSKILVGGQSMDRGFTIEGLTVTYMPRNIGVGNVDTIQQRARFFGYKKKYLGYCRVFLDNVTIDSYKNIIEHEEDVRGQLEGFNVNNRHLNDWDRRVVLDSMLNLTRANILYDDLERDRFGDKWFRINAPHDTEEFIQTNRETIFNFLNPKATSFVQDVGHVKRTVEQKHLVATLSIQDCLENLLNGLRFTRKSDSSTYSSLRGILKRYLRDNPNKKCLLYLMSATSLNDWKKRIRKLRKTEIQQLFQGRNPKIGEVIYPGDSEIKDDNILTIQIHLLNLRDTCFTNVPTLAIWIPEHIGRDIIRQV
ncbi:MAG: Z1 domain-containing protein [Ignavibacteria bacterium]